MLLTILKQFNWVDILVIILYLRIIYIAFKSGLIAEFFKLLGTLLAIYLALHYFTFLSDWVSARLPVVREKAPLESLDFLCFVILTLVGYFSFVLLRSVFSRIIKTEAMPGLNRWGGFILGLIRGYLVVGLVIFMFVISSISYLKKSTQHAYTGRHLFQVAPATYKWFWEKVASKFMTHEKFNATLSEIQEDFPR
ncbi:MAG: CvpA family protein [Candidatus Omnitrophica bacterium]|nr:CvpA family protein [Candidatus Omnitrophota bacterium]